MKRAFVSVASSYVGHCVASVLHRHGYEVVGSVREEDNEEIEAVMTETVDVSDEKSTVQLALHSDVIVLGLVEDVRGADAILTALQYSQNDSGGPTHLLVLSTTMTWAKTKLCLPTSATSNRGVSSTFPSSPLSRPASMRTAGRRIQSPTAVGNVASSSREALRQRTPEPSIVNRIGGTNNASSSRRRARGPPSELSFAEDDFLLRMPPAGFLEHKRLEVAALRLASPKLSTCVVGAGVPYGVGEGPLMQMFREAWISEGERQPLRLPTCTAGDNRLALVHVTDLSAVVGELLSFPAEQPIMPPAPFSKPYILAVDGDSAQPTAKEVTQAIGKAFGRSGETRPMEEQELEDVLVDDASALSLLFDLRFSNDGGVVAEMVSTGTLQPVTWSKGFVESAAQLAKEFVACRSLSAIRAIVLGPPGAGQDHVCKEISKRYGLLRVDAKIAADGVFAALGKPLPERAPPEDDAPTLAKGKKGKEAKNGPSKGGETTADIQAALTSLSRTERLMHNMRAAFEVAEVPMSEYTSFDARGLSGILPPTLVAEAARLVLEEATGRWLRRGFLLCDIPSRGGEAIEKIFPGDSLSRRRNSRAAAASTDGATNGSSNDTTNNGNRATPNDEVTPKNHPLDADTPTISHAEESFRPTHVVCLDAAAANSIFDVGGQRLQPGEGLGQGVSGVGVSAMTGGNKNESEQKVDEEIEQYVRLEGRGKQQPGSGGGEGADRRKMDGRLEPGNDIDQAYVRNDLLADHLPWLPATAVALRDSFGAKIQIVNSEADLQTLVHAVDLQLTGGETPAFMWMLAGDSGEAASIGVTNGDGRKGNGEEGPKEQGDVPAVVPSVSERQHYDSSRVGAAAGEQESDSLGLLEVLAKLTYRDAKEVETRTRRHRTFLTESVVPQVAAGLLAAAELRPADPFDFLAGHLIREGQALHRKAEAEAGLKYHAGLALLKEMEEWDNNKRARAAPGC